MELTGINSVALNVCVKALKTQGSGSLVGCNLCSFPGIRVGGACVYPGYRRYLLPDHPWRTRRQTPNLNETQFHCDETLGPPEQFNYSRYESLAKDVATFGLHELPIQYITKGYRYETVLQISFLFQTFIIY